MAMRRIERLINLIAALLETGRPMTAEDIRREIAGYDQANHEAFRRAFERDKEALRAMGIPVDVVPQMEDPFSEQADAYIIPKDKYYLPELDLEPDELTALRFAADALIGAGETAQSGLLKLSVDAPAAPSSGPAVRWGADVATEEPLLPSLYGALLDRSPVSFDYETASGDAARRTIETYGLVHRRGNWYAVGRDRDRDAIRAFRLSRIRSDVMREDGAYAIPPGSDAAKHLPREAYEIGAEDTDTASIRFSSTLRWWVEQNMSQAPVEEGPDGSLDVQVPVGNVDALLSWVIGFGPDAEILSPEKARSALLAHLAPHLEGTA